jgi:hypothetical protein
MADKPKPGSAGDAIKRIEKSGKALSPKKQPPTQKRPGHARDDQ